MKNLKLVITPLEFRKKEWRSYNNLLVGKQAARLNDIVSRLYENVHEMQKMFTDTVTSADTEKDKTKRVIHEEWNEKRSKSFKSLNY